MFLDLIQVGGWLAKSILQQSPSAASVLSNPPYKSRPACSQVKHLLLVNVHFFIVWGFYPHQWSDVSCIQPLPFQSPPLSRTANSSLLAQNPPAEIVTLKAKFRGLRTNIRKILITDFKRSPVHFLCQPSQDSIALSPNQGSGDHSTLSLVNQPFELYHWVVLNPIG